MPPSINKTTRDEMALDWLRPAQCVGQCGNEEGADNRCAFAEDIVDAEVLLCSAGISRIK